MRRLIAAFLLIAVLAIGGGIIATTAYQAGLSTAVATVSGTGGAVVTPVAPIVTPVVVPIYGYGWHPFGFASGIFGFFATIFFLFIVFGLLRMILFRGGPGRYGGWGHGRWAAGGPGGDDHGRGDDGHGRSRWEARAHDTFDEWHGRAHAGAPAEGTAPGTSTPTDPA